MSRSTILDIVFGFCVIWLGFYAGNALAGIRDDGGHVHTVVFIVPLAVIAFGVWWLVKIFSSSPESGKDTDMSTVESLKARLEKAKVRAAEAHDRFVEVRKTIKDLEYRMQLASDGARNLEISRAGANKRVSELERCVETAVDLQGDDGVAVPLGPGVATVVTDRDVEAGDPVVEASDLVKAAAEDRKVGPWLTWTEIDGGWSYPHVIKTWAAVCAEAQIIRERNPRRDVVRCASPIRSIKAIPEILVELRACQEFLEEVLPMHGPNGKLWDATGRRLEAVEAVIAKASTPAEGA